MAQTFDIRYKDNVALVTLNNIKSDVESLHRVFEIVSDEGICVDMISQTAPLNNCVNVSFTVDDNDTAKVISIIYKFKEVFSTLTTQILSNNTKVLISGEQMRNECGIATRVLSILAKAQIPISLITTAETEISLLVTEENALRVKQIMEELNK
ncbi:MAG: ACT domain-containing protein [Clostridia bacterium]|nr:ACT domain-containing protein [Clostridia bacterium]